MYISTLDYIEVEGILLVDVRAEGIRTAQSRSQKYSAILKIRKGTFARNARIHMLSLHLQYCSSTMVTSMSIVKGIIVLCREDGDRILAKV